MWTDKHIGKRGHSLMSKEAAAMIPPIGTYASKSSEEMKGIEPHAKLFTPMSNWTWYILEMDHETGECYGLVDGLEMESGYFDLTELSEVTLLDGLLMGVERDLYWTPETLGSIRKARDLWPVVRQR